MSHRLAPKDIGLLDEQALVGLETSRLLSHLGDTGRILLFM